MGRGDNVVGTSLAEYQIAYILRGVKRSAPQDEEEDDEPPDEVRLWEDGFKEHHFYHQWEWTSKWKS